MVADLKEDLIILKPTKEKVKIRGRMLYHEASQAWNTLRIKKPLLNDFPDLKKKQGEFSYMIIRHHTYKELRKEIEELEKKESDAVPLLFFLCMSKK